MKGTQSIAKKVKMMDQKKQKRMSKIFEKQGYEPQKIDSIESKKSIESPHCEDFHRK